MSKLCLIVLVSFLCSCSVLDKFSSKKTKTSFKKTISNEQDLELGVEADELTGETFEQEQQEIERIVGSSKINREDGHLKGSYFLYGAEHLELENYYFDFPVKYNKEVKRWIHYFTGKGRGHFLRYANRAGRYAPVMAKILERYKF